MKSAIFLLLFFITLGGVAQSPGDNQSSIPSGILNDQQLHTAILTAFDAGNYAAAARLLETMDERYPEKYAALPYALLHARSLALSEKITQAQKIYRTMLSNDHLSHYAPTPLARISTIQGNAAEAIQYYEQQLTYREIPDALSIAREALEYSFVQRRWADVLNLSRIVQANSASKRLGQFYEAKAYRAKGEEQRAHSLLENLLDHSKRDDITDSALIELDSMDGNRLNEEDRMKRGKIAFAVWNFDLVRKYLQGLATKDIQSAYYYARALSNLDDFENSKKAFQVAAGLWPDDPIAKLCLYQYASLCLRQGDYETAEKVYKSLQRDSKNGVAENATYKLVEVYRAQSRFQEAADLLTNFLRSRKGGLKNQRALFLRARVYYQRGKYSDSLADLNQLLKARSPDNRKEVLYWKGFVLEKIGTKQDAIAVYKLLSQNHDFYALLAHDKVTQLGAAKQSDPKLENVLDFKPLQLPDSSAEPRVAELYREREMLPALLYLHLYEEAGERLSSISGRSWELLGIDPAVRKQKYFGLVQLAALCRNYSTANYYAEILFNHLLPQISPFSLSRDVLKVLFPLPYNEEVVRFSKERKLDPFLVLSIMKQESKFKQYAKSPAFARGLMQLIPTTATQLAAALGLGNFSIDQLYHPETNINLGTKYVQDLIKEFGDRIEVIAASYNGGEVNARRWLGNTSSADPIEFFSNIDFPETRNYVMKVKTNYEWYKWIYGNEPDQRTAFSIRQ